jgi:hypothetical protein
MSWSWNPVDWVKTGYDVTGLDSAVKFGDNIGSGKFSEAGKQLGRGGQSLWKYTPADNAWNNARHTSDFLRGKKSFKDFVSDFAKEQGYSAWDTVQFLPGVKPATIATRLASMPLKQLLKRVGTSAYQNAIFSGVDEPKASAATTQPSGGYGTSAAELRRKEQDDLLAWKQSRAYGTSAAELRRKEEDDKRKAAEGAYDSGIAAAERNNIPPIVTNQQQTLGAAPGGLVGLSPEDTYQFAMQERALQKQYDDLLNELALQEQQGTLDTATSRYGIQREAAGAGQDVATQLAAAGLDFSPASAIGAEQLVQGARAQQEAAAAKNLADLIAEIQKQKTQAKGGLDISKLLLKGDIGRQRIANTIGNINSYYDMFGGA